jgi:CDP-diacylglycerol--serine O-phosphatidyltransferase
MLFVFFMCYIVSGPIGFIMTLPRRRRLEKAIHKAHGTHPPLDNKQE